jgi:hypothetical protein
MHSRLFMASVVNFEILIRHNVEDREDMIARQCKNIPHALELERFTDQMTSRDSGHSPSS